MRLVPTGIGASHRCQADVGSCGCRERWKLDSRGIALRKSSGTRVTAEFFRGVIATPRRRRTCVIPDRDFSTGHSTRKSQQPFGHNCLIEIIARHCGVRSPSAEVATQTLLQQANTVSRRRDGGQNLLLWEFDLFARIPPRIEIQCNLRNRLR
jgi:hypothetical protein